LQCIVYTPEIPLQLGQKLGVPLLEHPHRTFADPLWEVGAGHKSITSHTVLEEQMALTLQVIYPDYVLILTGTNDMQSMVRPKTWGKYIVYIKRLPTVPTLQSYQNNVQVTILDQIVSECNEDRVAIIPFYEALESIIEKKNGKKA
jgi:hypothetical protein